MGLIRSNSLIGLSSIHNPLLFEFSRERRISLVEKENVYGGKDLPNSKDLVQNERLNE